MCWIGQHIGAFRESLQRIAFVQYEMGSVAK
ncbi:hypothetical protein R69746_08031 [Paraburkholderia aspalathi]|nr:hypothetical protein R69746_08031 [Paraburkholderia aspalathi]